jgi:predicted  nucleic acid-binding Zn-ribbon protein
MHPSEMTANLVKLNEYEDIIESLGPRSKKRQEAEAEAKKILDTLPRFIRSHHERIRKLGRSSVAKVNRWICQSCFISVPVGARSALARGTDLSVCESCGAYLYMPEGELESSIENQKTSKSRKA